MPSLSDDSTRVYSCHWDYLKNYITDVNNVRQTMEQLNSITTTARGKPVSIYSKRNYLTAIMHQVRELPGLRKEYSPYMRDFIGQVSKISNSQECSDNMKNKLKDLTWKNILEYKQKLIDSRAVSTENKLLIRLYTELQYPVRNDFAKITVFIDKPRPADFTGNCIMLTRNPIAYTPRKTRVIKRSVSFDDSSAEGASIYPVRNLIWLTQFKTSKHDCVRDIIQSIPDELANDIIQYCSTNGCILFKTSEASLSNRIRNMFYQVSERKIGINVLRHLKIMDEYKHVPLLSTRKQTADKMGHSVTTQELYRLRVD